MILFVEGRSQPDIAGFEDEDKAHEPKDAGGKKMDSTREPLEEMPPCQHLDFNSVRPFLTLTSRRIR